MGITNRLLRRLNRAGRWLSALSLLVVLAGGNVPAAPVAAAGPSLEVQAPRSAKIGEQILLTLAVRDASDIAAYEGQLLYDTSAVDFDGLHQRKNDLKSVGRDVAALGPVDQPNGIAFGLYSCPQADCVDRGSARHERGGGGRVQLATLGVVAHKAGTVELRLTGAKFVDADGNDVAVQGADTTVRVEVGGASAPLFPAPAAPGRPAAAASNKPNGPFDLTHDGVVDHGDSVLVAFGWQQARQRGAICGAGIDANLDLNHDGCLDVADAQLLASHFGDSAPRATSSADPAAVVAAAPVAAEPTPDDDSDLSVAAVGAAAPLAVPLNLVVNSTADLDDATPGDNACRTTTGVCTLRAAIQEANAHAGPDNISFSLPGAGVQHITASGGLPTLTDAGTTIDGYTQTGSSVNTSATVDNAHILIEVDGPGFAGVGNTLNEAAIGQTVGIVVGSSNNTIRGLAITGYVATIQLLGLGASTNTIVGNFIGTDAAGSVQPSATPGANGITGAGVSLLNGAEHNQIGNVSAADRNVISGNFGSGVAFFHEGTDFNQIFNNLIGLNPAGTGRLLNTKHGIDVNSTSSFNVFGGTAAGQRNVIGGNLENGIEYSHDTLTVGNQAVGNYIGSDVTGNAAPAALANGGWGFHLHDGPTNNTFSSNVVVNNALGGMQIEDFNNFGNHIVNNRIGVGSQGAALPNPKFGIEVHQNASHVTIGPGNIIANNPEGIFVVDNTSTSVTITRNSIFKNRGTHLSTDIDPCPGQASAPNSGRGIDLGPLDACDPNGPTSASPANNGVVGPTLVAANTTAVDARTCASCTVEVFLADAPAAAAGSVTPAGQGQTFVGSGVADSAGRALVPISNVAVGNVITATTTDTLGDTSEFATNITVTTAALTASPPPAPATLPAALDTFTRVVSNGWANANAGGAWATEALTNHTAGQSFPGYNVTGTVGTMLNDSSGLFKSAYLTDVSARDVDVTFRVKASAAAPSGGFLFAFAAARRTGSAGGNEYLNRLTLSTSGVTLQAFKLTNGSCTALPCSPVAIGAETGAPAAHFTPNGGFIWMHAQVVGANPTTIRLRAWDDGTVEPTTWNVQVTDSEPVLQSAGSVGLRSLVTGTLTTAITTSFDDFQTVSSDGAAPPPPTPTPIPPTPTPAPTGSSPVQLLTAPVRLVDTRPASGGAGPIVPGTDQCFTLAGKGGIPLDAAGAVVNLTATGQAGRGWLTLYPAGQPLPATSTLNFDTTQFAIANGAVARLGTGGAVCLDAGQVSSQAIIDVTGYVSASGATAMPLLAAPTRVVDSRPASGGAGPIVPGTDQCFTIAGKGGVPTTAAGVLLNVTAVGYAAQGWLTLYPQGQTLPATSTLNFDPREAAIANNITVAVGPTGQVCVDAGQTSSQVIIDVVGYLTSAGISQLPLLAPARVADSRTAGGAVVPGADRCVQIAGKGGVPLTATGVILNLTATGQAGAGWLTIYPTGQPLPATSTLNFDVSEWAIANGAVVRLGTGGQICVDAGQTSAQFIIDVTGYLP